MVPISSKKLTSVTDYTLLAGMPNIYEINADGLFSYPMIGGNEHDNVRGELIVVSSTECGQLALTIEIKDEVYPGWHGFFTWLLFKYFR
ncbi:hypothetical protein FRC00_012212, partial [Tulasnella sp. 408]